MMDQKSYKSALHHMLPFLIIAGIYIAGLAASLIKWGYYESFMWLNTDNYLWLDQPMFMITHLGDSLILASILSMLLIYKKPELVLTLILLVVITGITGQLLKNFMFDGWDRPLRHFNESPSVHTLPFYRLFHNSFPSGHSITAMTALTAIVYGLRPKKLLQIIIALAACIISYSRIYLGVHFPGDVLAGSIIGIMLTLIIMPFLLPLAGKINYSRPIKNIIFTVALIAFIAGVWFLASTYVC